MSDHWRSMFDSKYLGNWDLPRDRDCIVEIESVSAGTLTSLGGRTDKKPIVKFVGKEKGLALNKTNAKAIAGMYGDHTREWKGKLIAIYVTTTSSPEGTVDCIRVRPTKPSRRRAKAETQPQDEQQQAPSAPEGADDGSS